MPDGKGGLLPAIKRPLPASRFSPTTEESRMLGVVPASPAEQIPPPLVPQRPSVISPMSRQTSQTAFFFGSANQPARPVRQVRPVQLLSQQCFTKPLLQSLPGNFMMPTRPSMPAPVRGGPGPRVARQSLTSAGQDKEREADKEKGGENEGKEDNSSETSKSHTE